MTTNVPFKMFDADNHYYEPLDAFTRHLDPRIARRAFQWAQVNGRTQLLICGQVHRFIPNPTFDPIAAPGVLDDHLRGNRPRGERPSELFGELHPISDYPEYRNRDARLALMDRQGIESVIMLPTLGVVVEQNMLHDPEALVACFKAFNTWVDEDWGFNYQDRIYAAALISLYDVDAAVAEVKHALDRDARFLVMVPGPVVTPGGTFAPTDRRFDPFWSLVNEAGITVLLHTGDNHYSSYLADWGRSSHADGFRRERDPFRSLISQSPVQDYIAALIAGRLFERFPKVRVASIENGCDWSFHLFEKLKKAYALAPLDFAEHPRDTFARHVWVAPYYEDDLAKLRDLIGDDRILMGSDFPHVEGLAEPATYIEDLRRHKFDDAACRKVMRDNARKLAERAPAA